MSATGGLDVNWSMEHIEQLAKDSIQQKIKGLPDSQLMRVDEVTDILLDLQQELLSSSSSASPELAPAG